jgi:putative glycosyltransferase (TIGR04372 family)
MLAGEMEVWLCERDAGMHGRRAVDVWSHDTRIANHQLARMFERTVHVSRFARSAARVNWWLPGGRGNTMPWRKHHGKDIHGFLHRTKPHLSFTLEELQRGRALLTELGIPENVEFVCFHATNQGYRKVFFPDEREDITAFRRSNIQTYLDAAEEFTRRGYVAIRMGAFVQQALRSTNPRIIDYATTGRSDFLDIFLCAHCRFYLGDMAGLNAVPQIFRRPIAVVNTIPLEHFWGWNPYDLFIPKKLWLRRERQFLTFPEIFRSGIMRFLRNELYEKYELDIVDNTPEEISALAVEMDERLKGTWRSTDEDEELQRRFRELFGKYAKLDTVIRARIGTQFLRDNRVLLDAKPGSKFGEFDFWAAEAGVSQNWRSVCQTCNRVHPPVEA